MELASPCENRLGETGAPETMLDSNEQLRHIISVATSVVLVALAGLSRPAAAQPQPTEKPTAKSKSVTVQLETKDGVDLHCAYYEGSKTTETVPVILIHGFDGHAGEWAKTAAQLQAQGYSVVVPDLRGHGKSTQRTDVDGRPARKLTPARLRRDDLERMVTMDLEAVKKFLLGKHNQEELNIDRLTVVGSEFGSIIAALWTVRDWSWPLVAGQRQGQDVKAIVLLSPIAGYKGLNLQQAITAPAFKEIAALVVYGKNGKVGDGARRIFKSLERVHNENAKPRVYEWAIDTNLQGAKLLQQRKLGIAKLIAEFIDSQIVQNGGDYPYQKRDRI